MARFITRKEAEGRKFRLRVFAGMFDFLATIGSLILIFACVALLASLVTWIRNDAKTTFRLHRVFHHIGADHARGGTDAAGNATAPALTAGAFFLKKGEGRVRVSWSSPARRCARL